MNSLDSIYYFTLFAVYLVGKFHRNNEWASPYSALFVYTLHTHFEHEYFRFTTEKQNWCSFPCLFFFLLYIKLCGVKIHIWEAILPNTILWFNDVDLIKSQCFVFVRVYHIPSNIHRCPIHRRASVRVCCIGFEYGNNDMLLCLHAVCLLKCTSTEYFTGGEFCTSTSNHTQI